MNIIKKAINSIFETWKPAQYYHSIEGLIDLSDKFEVSNRGGIRRVNSSAPLEIRYDGGNQRAPVKYQSLLVHCNGKCRRLRLGRMILSTFSPRSDAQHLTTDHIDGDKHNNHITNLEWITAVLNKQRFNKKYHGEKYVNYDTVC